MYDLVQTTREDLQAILDDVEACLEDLRKYNISRVVLSPNRWANCQIQTSLSWRTIKFEKDQSKELPQDKGEVYTFIVKPGIANHPECSYLLYVGKTELQGFRKRFLQYFDESRRPKGREPVKFMINLWGQHLWFCYAPIEDIDQIDTVEQSLLSALVPPINQEFPSTLKRAIKAWP